MQILERDAHDYGPDNCRIPLLELQVVWKDESERYPDRLVEFIDIEGTVRPKTLTLQYEPGRTYPQGATGTNGNNSRSVQCA